MRYSKGRPISFERVCVSAILFAAVISRAFSQDPADCCSVAVQVRTTEGFQIPEAAVAVESGAIRYTAQTSSTGGAEVSLRTPGRYRISISAEGYASQVQETGVERDERARLEFVLARRDSIAVVATAEALEATGASVDRESVRALPERIADVRGALPLIPGVVRTPEGKLRISGSPEYRSTYLVNSIDVSDPATGSFGATVPVDVIETVQVYKSPFLAEFGKFSAAVVAVSTRRGGDTWHFEVNDPTPEFRIRSGHIQGVRGFTPRVAATGPLKRNRLYFAGAGSFELRKRPVYPLPFPFNEEKSQRVNAYAQFDYVPRATHLVSVALHGVPQRTSFANLNFYRPQEAAPSWEGHEYRCTISDRVETDAGVVESSLSVAELRGRTWAQGGELLTLAPNESYGNYFFAQDRRTQRGQWVETFSLKPKSLAGTHAIKLGGSLGRTTMDGYALARALRIVSMAGDELGGLTFANQPPYDLTDWDGGAFLQDGWQPLPAVRLDAGVRVDRQRLAGVTTVAPRVGVAWLPREGGGTVLRGGYGWFYDRVPLNVFAFPRHPWRFGLPNVLERGEGFAPHSRTFSAGVDQRVNRALLLHAGYIQSRHSRLLIVNPRVAENALSGDGSASTRELELTGKLTFYPGQQLVVSYVHTRGRGNLNLFDDFLGDFPEPLLRPDLVARLPAIVPHRFLSWGVFPLPYGLQFAPVVEWRNGFPYSALDQRQQYAEAPNARRLPAFFSLDTRVSKDIPVRGHKFRLSFSMFNVTNHGNFDVVRLNTADPQFGEALGRRPRRFRLDFDWLF